MDNGNCSSAVKAALLLSKSVTFAQKQEVLKTNPGGLITYAKTRGIYDEVAYGAATLTRVLFDENGQFTLPDNIKNAKKFFNPTTFTPEERLAIVEYLEAKVEKAEGMNKIMILRTIADFTPDIEQKVETTKSYLGQIKSYAEQYLKDNQLINDENQVVVQVVGDKEKNAVDFLSEQLKEYNNLMNMFVDGNVYEFQTQKGLLNNFFGIVLSAQTGVRFSMAIEPGNFVKNPANAISEFLKKIDTTDLLSMLDAIKDEESYKTTLNQFKLRQLADLRSFEDPSFILWKEFELCVFNDMKQFRIEKYKNNEQADREILKNWLKENNIEIEVAEYELNQMDELAKAIETKIKRRTKLKTYTPPINKS